MRELAAAALFCGVVAAQTAWEQSMAVGMKALGKGSYGEAQQQLEAALEAAASRPQEATTLARLGLMWERQKEWVRAGEYYARSLSAREKEYGPESAEVATGLEHLARVLVQTGRETEAKEKEARAFGIRAARIAAESPPPAAGEGEAVARSELDAAPQLVHRVDPEYDEEARLVRQQGTVELSVVVGLDGRVHNVRLERSLGLGLDEKAAEALGQWRFKPGFKDGKAVRVKAKVSVNFRLL